MPGLTYDMAWTTGHDTYPPTRIRATQGKVFVDGIHVVVAGDTIVPHTNTVEPYDTHSGYVIPTTSKIYVGGKPAASIGDPTSDGDTIAQSSSKVFIK
ncbi:phospholipase [Aeromonas phage Riv-10]|nr:phospholipase [Aeromonas phage Riv-10]